MYKNKLFVSSGIIALLIFASFAFNTVPPKDGPKNLKVLLKDIDHATLIKFMHDFSTALGTRCTHCHAMSATKEGDLDFASDAKPEKSTARKMMKMMMKINRKYFDVKRGNFAEMYDNSVVTCYSCHHGNMHPVTAPAIVKKEQQ